MENRKQFRRHIGADELLGEHIGVVDKVDGHSRQQGIGFHHKIADTQAHEEGVGDFDHAHMGQAEESGGDEQGHRVRKLPQGLENNAPEYHLLHDGGQ